MFQKGEYIMYGSTGVCRVEDVAVPDNIPMKDEVVRSNRISSSMKKPEIWLYKAIFRAFLFFLKWKNMDMKTLKKPHKLTHKLTLFHFFHFIMQISNVDVICILIDSSGKFRMAEHFRQSDW